MTLAGTICHGAVVQQALLIRLGLGVGDAMKIVASFRITGVIHSGAGSHGQHVQPRPRVLISQEGLAAADLTAGQLECVNGICYGFRLYALSPPS